MVGNVVGVIVEGLWCLFCHGKWQTHVVALWGPFNIVYGIGIAVFFICDSLFYGYTWPIRVAVLAVAGSLVECLCGLVIRLGILISSDIVQNRNLFHW